MKVNVLKMGDTKPDTKPGFFFNIFTGGLYFDALNLELFQICLIISQSLGKSTL